MTDTALYDPPKPAWYAVCGACHWQGPIRANAADVVADDATHAAECPGETR